MGKRAQLAGEDKRYNSVSGLFLAGCDDAVVDRPVKENEKWADRLGSRGGSIGAWWEPATRRFALPRRVPF